MQKITVTKQPDNSDPGPITGTQTGQRPKEVSNNPFCMDVGGDTSHKVPEKQGLELYKEGGGNPSIQIYLPACLFVSLLY